MQRSFTRLTPSLKSEFAQFGTQEQLPWAAQFVLASSDEFHDERIVLGKDKEIVLLWINIDYISETVM